MYNLQIIEDRIMGIASSMGLSKNKLLYNVQLNKSVFDNMKKGQIPSMDKIHKIADYLNVSIDYLVGRTDEPAINTKHNSFNTQYDIAAYGGTDNENIQPAIEKESTDFQ